MTHAIVILVLCCAMAVIITETRSLRGGYYNKRTSDTREGMSDPKKRPFCNAFTGCGRKRSNLPPLQSYIQNEPLDESLGSLLELSAEPAVEELSRQILSEAKLWEAIQEANMELKRRRLESAESEQDDATDAVQTPPGAGNGNTRGAAASCAVPPCYIKK